MAVSITVNLNTIDEADSTTGWGENVGEGLSTYSGFEREDPTCLGAQASNGYIDAYHTDTGLPSFADVTVFTWQTSAAPYTEASNGFGIVLGDGTNRIAYTTGGSDNFGHFVKGYASFRLDTSNLPTNFRTLQGSEASLNLASISEVGPSMSFASKAVGNSDNVFLDVVRYIANGNAALTVAGGGAATPGTFAEIVADDASQATGKAYGVARTLIPGTKSYAFDYAVDFGNSGTGASYFEDSDFQLYLNGTNLGTGHIDVNLLANSTGTNLFKLDNFVVVSTGAVSNWDLSTPNSNTMEITNGQFVNCGTFSLPVTGGTSRKVENTTFVNCGQVDSSTCTITRLTFVGTTDANGAILANRDMDAHSFTSDGTGHAIYITSPGTYTYTSNSFSGYGATGTTDAVIYNNSGGSVTINVNSGDTPTYRNGTGASTTIVAGAVTVKVKASTATGTPIQNARVLLRASDGTGPFPYDETVTISNSGTTATVTHTAHGMATNDYVQIYGGTLSANEGVFQITVTGANTYTYTMSSTPGSSPTGTITATFVALYGSTDVNGEISTSRVYSANQPVTGWTRKSTTSPYYREGILTGSVSSTQGYNSTAVMISDE